MQRAVHRARAVLCGATGLRGDGAAVARQLHPQRDRRHDAARERLHDGVRDRRPRGPHSDGRRVESAGVLPAGSRAAGGRGGGRARELRAQVDAFLLVTALSPRAIYSASTWPCSAASSPSRCARRGPHVLSLVALYLVFAIGAGGETGQYAVVMVELVGVKRMAAAHALYTLLAGPIFAAGPSLAGFIKDRSSWASAYCVLGVGYAVAAVIDSINLLVVVEYCRRKQSTARKAIP